jgi:DAACS family dicarboxylate/amino acid:cation (Na+ or H+) symporter
MRWPLHVRTLLGAVLGAALGGVAFLAWGSAVGQEPAAPLRAILTYGAHPVGQIFLRLLFMLVVPLLFAALALGVAGLGDVRSLGRIGLKMLGYTVLVSSIAVLLGVLLVNVIRPGEGLSPELHERLTATASERAAKLTPATPPRTGIDLLVQIVPDNPLRAAANGDFLAVMFFALLFGVGLALTRSEGARRVEAVLEGLYDVTMRLIQLVIALAPIGVFALMFSLTAELGYEVLRQLLSYVAVVLLALTLHQFVIFSLSVYFLGGRSPLWFFRSIQEAMLTAFTTSSSNATLPTALKVAEQNLKLPAHVSRFVLTIGSTANQNGTALFEGVTVLFLAQFYGVELSLQSQVTVVAICILGGIGTAGVPSGSIPVIAMILGLVNVPPEGIGLILGIDRFLDMCRTTLNVTGDLAAAVIVSRGEESRSGST